MLKKSYLWYLGLLIEVKFYFVSEVSYGIVMSPVFRNLFIIASFEGGIVLYNILGCVNEYISARSGVSFGHSGAFGSVISESVNRRCQTGKSK